MALKEISVPVTFGASVSTKLRDCIFIEGFPYDKYPFHDDDINEEPKTDVDMGDDEIEKKADLKLFRIIDTLLKFCASDVTQYISPATWTKQ